MTERTEHAAVAAPDPVGDDAARELLQSIVDVARAIFGAQAGSVFLLDEERDELVFQAVSGRGETFLVGRRFPADRGIAGWVATSGESMVVDDLRRNATFDRSLAESTEYVPDALMAVPLIHGDRVLGVLEVLDPAPQCRSSLSELDLLALFARQAAAALRIAIDRRTDRLAAEPSPADTRRAEAVRLVTELEHLLRETPDR
ncbi:GAF domain-containing protein [Streptacidiphilus albus]|uniref:GAF domain-containing protein n=1 Tax=Streptacidiphilus albus TaxID=105425 RepID=UPI00054B4526|nr:GAF domain-containing protein [Streptacidiphilus albus]